MHSFMVALVAAWGGLWGSAPPVKHRVKHKHHVAPMRRALASWFYDAGVTGCGFHATYGIAALNVPCGTRLRLCYVGCVTATREDSGPYVAGRTFDLNPTVRAALHCPDLCWLRWRPLSSR